MMKLIIFPVITSAIDTLSTTLDLILKHGLTNELINKSVIKLIPKNMRKSLSVSSNYRAISKNTIISKIVTNVMLLKI